MSLTKTDASNSSVQKRSVPSICPGHLQMRSHLHVGSQPHVLGNHAGVRNSGSLNHPDQSCNRWLCQYYNLHLQRRSMHLATIINKHYANLAFLNYLDIVCDRTRGHDLLNWPVLPHKKQGPRPWTTGIDPDKLEEDCWELTEPALLVVGPQPYSDWSAILYVIAFCLATSNRSPSLNASFARSTAGGVESREFAAGEIFSRTSSLKQNCFSCIFFLKTMLRSSQIFFASLLSAASLSADNIVWICSWTPSIAASRRLNSAFVTRESAAAVFLSSAMPRRIGDGARWRNCR